MKRLSRRTTQKQVAMGASLNTMINKALEHSQSKATIARSRTVFRQLKTFCKDNNIPNSAILPTDELVLCGFAASHCGILAGSTVQGKIWALKALHSRRGHRWNGGERLRKVLQGVSKATPATSMQPQREPVTTRMLELLHDGLNANSRLDACVYAVATVAFFGQLRLGEILPQNSTANQQVAGRVPLASHISEAVTTSGSRYIHLPTTKTTGSRAANSCCLSFYSIHLYIRYLLS